MELLLLVLVPLSSAGRLPFFFLLLLLSRVALLARGRYSLAGKQSYLTRTRHLFRLAGGVGVA